MSIEFSMTFQTYDPMTQFDFFDFCELMGRCRCLLPFGYFSKQDVENIGFRLRWYLIFRYVIIFLYLAVWRLHR